MRLEDTILRLRALSPFKGFDTEALRLLAFSAVKRTLRPGDVLFRKGELSDGAYLVIEGEIVLDPDDSGAPSAHVFGPGHLIGAKALLTRIERPATAIARGPALVLVFTRDLMLKVLEAYPASAAPLHEALTDEARALVAALERFARG